MISKEDITVNYHGISFNTELVFDPYQSLLYKIEKGRIEQIDITFIPKTPIVKERPSGYVAPWLVR
jgi:hypothetical protein